jgi:Prophage minor tail protein Z (GPZ)
MSGLNINTAQIRAYAIKLEQFDPKVRAKAIGRGLQKVAKQGKTEAKKQITSEYNVKSSDVEARLSVRVERVGSSATAYVAAKYLSNRKRIPLIKFSAKDTKRRGVTFKVLRKGKRDRLRHAFIATMPSGHTGVYQRTRGGKSISEVKGIDIVPMFAGKRVKPLVIKKMEAAGPRVIEHELAFELKRAGLRIGK